MAVPLGGCNRRLEEQLFFQIQLIQPATESNVEILRIFSMETAVPLRRGDLKVIRVGRISLSVGRQSWRHHIVIQTETSLAVGLTRVAIRFFTFAFFDEVAKTTRARSTPGRVFMRGRRHFARLGNAVQHGRTRRPPLQDSHGVVYRFYAKAGAGQVIWIA